jgi:hypothetical protein
MLVYLPEQLSAISACSAVKCRRSVEAGGLIGYGSPIPANDCRATTDVDKILNGTKPTTFELVINRASREG